MQRRVACKRARKSAQGQALCAGRFACDRALCAGSGLPDRGLCAEIVSAAVGLRAESVVPGRELCTGSGTRG